MISPVSSFPKVKIPFSVPSTSGKILSVLEEVKVGWGTPRGSQDPSQLNVHSTTCSAGDQTAVG